ncbi:hypothetical protein [Nocardioides sp. CER19]|uniref:hypothetical protein n=1 Tax=Nocardioides sp. CER19 TaxID=3038538 RepID=UPI00244A5F85|nr:hypothetical protein [Nocardioides sp. CER19]MDH2412724.1 hypothetical protein [Nocardioides sp. CER19]
MSAAPLVEDRLIGLAIGVPAGWRQLVQEPDDEGFAPLVLAPEPWTADDGFRPNITVVASAPQTPAPSPHQAGTEAIAAALALPDTRVLAYDLWLEPPGRRLVFAYLDERIAVQVTQFVFVHRGRVVTVTASADTDRCLRVNAAVDEAVSGLRLLPERTADA